MSERIGVDTKKTVLSSVYRIYKTDKYLAETKNFADADLFTAKMAESIILNQGLFFKNGLSGADFFKLETEDKSRAFFFAFLKPQDGQAPKENTFKPKSDERTDKSEKTDIVFFKYSGKDSYIRRGDRSLRMYLDSDSFYLTVEASSIKPSIDSFYKLYRLSNSPSISFPALNKAQREIVSVENQNVLVQGVAGSGKTNLCIEKIVYSAGRSYAGRVLYSTFSRGLLIDTQNKVRQLIVNLRTFISDYSLGRVVFSDGDKKRAIENKLGIHFIQDNDNEIIAKVQSIADFLENNVDYLLIEDFYRRIIGGDVELADEKVFANRFIKDLKNHRLTARLEKISHLSYEVVYKEIYGVIFGCCDPARALSILSFDEYFEKRRDSFSRDECDIIYRLSREYESFLRQNNLTDNNFISRELISHGKLPKYSLAVLDEVQDMTEVNLFFMRGLALKLFCVGDALQMINPSYFSFAYLKRLLFEKDIISVSELSFNYRSTKKIAELIGELGQLNIKQFGTHSFVLKTTGIDDGADASMVFLKDKGFLDAVNSQEFNNFTIIVSSVAEKERLRKRFKKQEILTVSEIKGLERDVVVLYNVLSSNIDKWKTLERLTLNRKTSDENSVYRYYFNLFYVGLSRGKTHIYVAEDFDVPQFKEFFKNRFRGLNVKDAQEALKATSDKTEAEQDEILERANEFIRLGQFDNARFSLDRLISQDERKTLETRIDIYEGLVKRGNYREAGVRFWEAGLITEAREQFLMSKDTLLIDLMDACTANDEKELNIDITAFLPDVLTNEPAKRVILDTVKKDCLNLKNAQKTISGHLKSIRSAKKT